MLETTTKGIWIITDDTATEEVDGSKGGDDTGADYGNQLPDGRPGRKRSRISAEELRQNMEEFLAAIEETFEKAERSNCQMQLQELKLSVEINGKGQVSLLGTGGEAGAKGAIELTFKRRDG